MKNTRPHTPHAVVGLFALTLALTLAVSACTPAVVDPASLEDIKNRHAEAGVMQMPYRLGVGDEIEVKFFFAPELNDRIQIGPDGTISIMFAPHVRAAGLTPDELADVLKKKLAGHVRQPDMVVVVRDFGSQRVFVGGEVIKPGPVQLKGPESVLQALNEAGWMTPTAGADKIVVVRRDVAGKEKIYPVDVRKLMTGEDMSQNIQVVAGDVILVPPSDAASADRWIDQNIRQIMPFSSGVSAAYNINPSVTTR